MAPVSIPWQGGPSDVQRLIDEHRGNTSAHHSREHLYLDGQIAGEALTASCPVYPSADNTISICVTANAVKVCGVNRDICPSGGRPVVITYGPMDMTADGAITVGDQVKVAGTSGRVVTFTPVTGSGGAHTHSGSISESGTHTHSGTISSSGAHNHSVNTSTDGAHTHDLEGVTGSGQGHTHTVTGNTDTEANHTHTGGATDGPSATVSAELVKNIAADFCADTSGGAVTKAFTSIQTYASYNVPSDTHTHTSPTTGAAGTHHHVISRTTSEESTHTHSLAGKSSASGGDHYHTVTITTDGLHTHTSTIASSGGHTHTFDISSSGTHTHNLELGKVLGKAITAAAGAGNTVKVLVCLG